MTGAGEVTRADALAAAVYLPERQRIAFVLVDVEGKSTRQAARDMAISHKAVQKLLARARYNLGCLLVQGCNLSMPTSGA